MPQVTFFYGPQNFVSSAAFTHLCLILFLISKLHCALLSEFFVLELQTNFESFGKLSQKFFPGVLKLDFTIDKNLSLCDDIKFSLIRFNQIICRPVFLISKNK